MNLHPPHEGGSKNACVFRGGVCRVASGSAGWVSLLQNCPPSRILGWHDIPLPEIPRAARVRISTLPQGEGGVAAFCLLVTNEPLTAPLRNNSLPPTMKMVLKRMTTTTTKPSGVLVRAR
ncbi:hypothetical protein FHS83_002917 [Rhizomicrobium palustre]|uniref:Uncharacterized protein n=1 Tax=Rhizomicrobium palustre TaxID=189966 RepID=A0A846N269_9PROT|nr:hypothetical protein [Rhizomicrobium palustre]